MNINQIIKLTEEYKSLDEFMKYVDHSKQLLKDKIASGVSEFESIKHYISAVVYSVEYGVIVESDTECSSSISNLEGDILEEIKELFNQYEKYIQDTFIHIEGVSTDIEEFAEAMLDSSISVFECDRRFHGFTNVDSIVDMITKINDLIKSRSLNDPSHIILANDILHIMITGLYLDFLRYIDKIYNIVKTEKLSIQYKLERKE